MKGKFILFVLLLVSESLYAYGLWDEGLVNGQWRTDYNATNEGTVYNTLTTGTCLYPYADTKTVWGAGAAFGGNPCNPPPASFPYSNSTSSVSPPPQDNFWVVSANNELAYSVDSCNSGPPSQNKPVVYPGNGVFGFTIGNSYAGDTFKRASLVLNTVQFPNCNKTPFLSFGAKLNRGNGGNIPAYLRYWVSPQNITFTAKIWDISPYSSNANFAFFVATSYWASKPRMLILYLLERNPNGGLPGGQVNNHWNWNISESFWYPGADILHITVNELNRRCGTNLTQLSPTKYSEATYNINLRDTFECLGLAGRNNLWSDPLPDVGIIPIDGVHWAIEQSFEPNWTWVSFHGMRMY